MCYSNSSLAHSGRCVPPSRRDPATLVERRGAQQHGARERRVPRHVAPVHQRQRQVRPSVQRDRRLGYNVRPPGRDDCEPLRDQIQVPRQDALDSCQSTCHSNPLAPEFVIVI